MNPSVERRLWRAWLRFGGGMAVLALLAFVVFIGPAVLRSYDAHHLMTVRCTISSADGRLQSTSTRGVHRSIPQVRIETSDCGRFLLRHGVTRANREEVAARLPPGEYAIEIGAGSWKTRGLLHALLVTPRVYGAEPVW
jgi:hypothetical protein